MSLNDKLLKAAAAGGLTPSENFSVVTYTGNGATQSITGVGFKPDWLAIKERDGTNSWRVFDSTRGLTSPQTLFFNLNFAEDSESNTVSSFDADGFTMGSQQAVNDNGNTYVAYCWKANGGTTSSNTDGSITSTVQANTDAGFSIVSYTGDGNASSTVGHGLGAIPELTIFKTRSGTSEWNTYLTSNNTVGFLNNTTAFVSNTGGTNGSVDIANMSSTTFGFLNGSSSVNNQNGNGSTYIMYAFHSVEGFSKIGTYTGNGSANGPIVETGFEPAFLMIKRTDTADSWVIHDNKRDLVNPRKKYLLANASNAEASDLDGIDFLSNGFQLKDDYAYYNASGGTYLYMAFAADPDTEAPTLASSFSTVAYTGTGTNQKVEGLGLAPNLVWIKSRSTTNPHVLHDTVRGIGNVLYSNLTNAESDESAYFTSVGYDYLQFGTNAGNYNNTGTNYVAWAWKADDNEPTINSNGSINSLVSANANAGFSIVSYTGSGSSGSVGHGLSSTPELVIIKRLDGTTYWQVWYNGAGTVPASGINRLYLNDTQANDSSTTNVFYPDATKINLNSGDHFFNTSGGNYISYCWHSVAGYSKIGTYTGNGSSSGTVVEPGFSPDFVLVKRTDNTSNWGLFDSQRSGTYYQKGLLANTANSEYGETDTNSACEFLAAGHPDASNGGFRFRDSGSPYNVSSGTYIYMAFKINPTTYPLAGNMSFLVVAGGASGAVYHGGGGGAGGLRTSYGATSGGGASSESDITLAAGTYTITVGAGAAGVTYSSSNVAGNNGSDSSIAASGLTTITSIGGGGGSSYAGQTTPGNGGSGGGGGNQSQAGGTGTTGQGNDGGTGSSSSTNYPSGGGGGAGAVGGNGSGTTAGNGGAGLSVEITGSSVAYAGGAGGSSFRGGTAGTGGTGGGANGTNADGTGNAGATNTGGGGSGATAATSGAGGSGVAILRLLTSEYSSSVTGSPTVTTDGDYTVLTYTGSGTYVHS